MSEAKVYVGRCKGCGRIATVRPPQARDTKTIFRWLHWGLAVEYVDADEVGYVLACADDCPHRARAMEVDRRFMEARRP